MSDAARRVATYEDVLAAPRHRVAEILGGELRLSPRPAKPHAAAASALGEELGPPFKRGRGGPGGWILLDEPELHLGADIPVPDLAGWRRERLPVLTDDEPFFTLAPDWVCEVLSTFYRALRPVREAADLRAGRGAPRLARGSHRSPIGGAASRERTLQLPCRASG